MLFVLCGKVKRRKKIVQTHTTPKNENINAFNQSIKEKYCGNERN